LIQEFLRLDGSTTKDNMLTDVIKRASADTDRMIIFCNTVASVNHVHEFLVSKNIKSISMSSDNHPDQQKKDFAAYTDTEAEPGFMAMVATDMASRGVDTTLVGHVVLYDFPQTTIAYLHRVGRTARFDRKGRATSLLLRKDVPLAMNIRNALKSRSALSQ
jgi:ATP-dependent RNA helicase DeaD